MMTDDYASPNPSSSPAPDAAHQALLPLGLEPAPARRRRRPVTTLESLRVELRTTKRRAVLLAQARDLLLGEVQRLSRDSHRRVAA